MADSKISDLTALTTPAVGDYLPIVDISETAAASKNKRITIEELMRGMPDGTAAAPGIAFESDPNTGIYSPGADQVAISTGGTGRVTIDSSGRVGVGTTSPATALQVIGTATFGNGLGGRLQATTDSNLGYIDSLNNTSTQWQPLIQRGTEIQFHTNTAGTTPTHKVVIDSSGRVGIGTTSPSAPLAFADIAGTAGDPNKIALFSASGAPLYGFGISPNQLDYITGGSHVFFSRSGVTSTERARIDSSGRLLVGTSTARSPLTHTPSIQVEGLGYATSTVSVISNSNDTNGAYSFLGKSRGTSLGSNTVVQSGDEIGGLDFIAADGTQLLRAARITALVDGTPGAGDMPGRLVFSTTADGASTPTERMRISQNGGTLWRSDGATSTHDLGNSNASIAGEVVTVSAYRNTVNDTFRFLTCVRQGFAVALEIRDDGDVYNVNGTYGSLSDAKLKENIVDANSQWDDIKQLRVRNYNFKPETNNSTHKQIGVIAQEIENVSPGLVNTVADRDAEGNDLGTVTKSVNYSVLYMKAVKALQEAMERIETLEARVAALEA